MFRWRRTPKLWDEAASWHARMLEPGSAREVAEFEAWLARDPGNPKLYGEMEAVMAAAGAVPRAANPQRPLITPLLRPALAFGLAVVAIVSTAMLWQSGSVPAFATIANRGSAIRALQLEDGTRVWLDVGAEIGVRLSDDRREIEIRAGRVRIAPGPDARSLTIVSRSLRISPGTARTDVTVATGRMTVGAVDGPVAVTTASPASGQTSMRVGAGRAVAFEDGASRPVPIEGSWTASRLRFSDVPLSDILRLANRLGDPDIMAGDADISRLRISGVFDLRDTRRLARKLAATLDLRVEDTGARLILRR